jgi:cytoskeletal protein CcmA (bactofilin family)
VEEIDGQKNRLMITASLNKEDKLQQEIFISSPLLYTMVIGERLEQNFLSKINGDVYVAGDAEFDGAVNGLVFCGANAVISGDNIRKKPIYKPLTIPVYDREWIEQQGKAKPVLNNRIAELNFTGETLYKRGNLTIAKCNFKNCGIWVDGDLAIEGKFGCTGNKTGPAIIATGDIQIVADQARIEGLVYAAGKILLNGTGRFKGVLIANRVEIMGDWQIEWGPEILKKTSLKPELVVCR